VEGQPNTADCEQAFSTELGSTNEILLGYLVVEEEGRERDMEDSIFTWEERFEKEILGAPESALIAPAFAAVEVERVRRVLVHDRFAIIC
jgi:hypothetical protein